MNLRKFLYPVGALLILSLSSCTNIFFQPDGRYYSLPGNWYDRYEFFQTTTKDGLVLNHWFLLADEPLGTVFYLHGNAQNVSSHVASVYWLAKHGFNVFLFEYRGYGQSQGTPDLEMTMQDIEHVFGLVAKHPKAIGRPIVLFGQSLGASIGIYVASNATINNKLCAAIFESPFSNYRAFAREKLAGFWLTWLIQYPLSWAISSAYSPVSAISRISPVPVVIIHSQNDHIVPMKHGLNLFENAKQPKEFWQYSASHIGFLKTEQGQQHLLDYLAVACKRSG